jgi:predicted glycosyltransferase involved in capsule biosynthesis
MEAHPSLCKMNEWAANTRADFFKLPFVNQSFTMDKKSFLNVGGFSERVIQNEDAEFIKRWKQKGYFIKKATGAIKNSAQAFKDKGWLKTTAQDLAWGVKYCFGKEPRELIPHSQGS